jgi:chaperonin GroES
VLIKIDTAEEKTASGLFIPQTAQEKVNQGVVVALGGDADDSKIVLINDKVMYDKYAGTPVKIDGDEHLIIDVGDIIAVIE